MKLSAILEPLLRAGVDPDVILDAIRAFEAQQEAGEEATKEKARDRWRRYRNRRNLSTSEWLSLCSDVFARDGYVCAYCGDENGPHEVDHVAPLIQGGTNDLENLAVACKPCNAGKSGRSLEEWRGGK